jgi:hypothetical protein
LATPKGNHHSARISSVFVTFHFEFVRLFSASLPGKAISGLSKFLRRVQAERRFLGEIQRGVVRLAEAHVQCSNLGYLQAILDIV